MAKHIKAKSAHNLPQTKGFICTTCGCKLRIVYKHKRKFYCHKHALMNGWKPPVLIDVTRTTPKKRNATRIGSGGLTT
uniref:Uncharacterized protein n=1 Tax=viral metagenome TaxID=1070528 RepID=A0A6H1ZES8_9ZZZZ